MTKAAPHDLKPIVRGTFWVKEPDARKKRRTINLDPDQDAFLREHEANASELIRNLLGSHIDSYPEMWGRAKRREAQEHQEAIKVIELRARSVLGMSLKLWCAKQDREHLARLVREYAGWKDREGLRRGTHFKEKFLNESIQEWPWLLGMFKGSRERLVAYLEAKAEEALEQEKATRDAQAEKVAREYLETQGIDEELLRERGLRSWREAWQVIHKEERA